MNVSDKGLRYYLTHAFIYCALSLHCFLGEMQFPINDVNRTVARSQERDFNVMRIGKLKKAH